VDTGAITITINVKPFVRAVQTSLSAIADAASAAASAGGHVAEVSAEKAMAAAAASSKALASAGEAMGEAGGIALKATGNAAREVGEAGGIALKATGNAAREAMAMAQQAAFDLEDMVQEHPHEAAAVGVTLLAVAALKAALSRAKEEGHVTLPPTLLEKIKMAASASSTSLGAAFGSMATTATSLQSMSLPVNLFAMPSAKNISNSLTHMGIVTAASLKGAKNATVL